MSVPFICPVCRQALTKQAGSLACPRRHTFDIARQGYVNLLTKAPVNLYEDKALFLARRAVYKAGFFDPVIRALREAAMPGMMLDAGCGEGSLLARLTDGADCRVGLDIARPAIQMAAAAYKDAHWCVGDLCSLPLADASIDTLLNVLTPANYAEFGRVLRFGGRLLKIVPGPDHLAEIRGAVGKAAYGHTLDETLRVLQRQFVLLGTLPIRYSVRVDPALAEQVFTMTPMTAHESLPKALPDSIQVDVTLLLAQKLRRRQDFHAKSPAH